MAEAVYRKKVLSIDDNRDIHTVLKVRFEDAGYQFESAFSGQEGLDKVKSYAPDVVLLDIMMPVMDGYEVLSRMKSDDATRNVPVIMLSAKRQREDVMKAVGLGAKDYLVKPVDFKRLLEKVERALAD